MNLLVSELALTDPLLDRAIPRLDADFDHDFEAMLPSIFAEERPVTDAAIQCNRWHWLRSAPRFALLRRVFAEAN